MRLPARSPSSQAFPARRHGSSIVADLHVHSTASDGEYSPEDLVDQAIDAGLDVLSLTDHDTLAGVDRAVAHGAKRGLEVITGCELTTYDQEIELHVLAYFVSTSTDTPLSELLKLARARRKERALEMAARLRDTGIAIEDDAVRAEAAGADAVGQPHVARALVAGGHATSVVGAIRKYLRKGCPGYAPKYRVTPKEAIRAIHESGGIAVLAHPGLAPHDELIVPLFRLGMDGVEADHHMHSKQNRRFYSGLARRYERGVSGGSDFHGPRVKPDVSVGSSGVTREALSDLRKRARARASRSVEAIAASA